VVEIRAHYVPRAYLKFFADGNKRINVLSKINNQIRQNTLIDNICCQKNYYEITINDLKTNILEDMYSKLESDIDKSIKQVKNSINTLNYNKSKLLISDEIYKFNIATIMHMQHIRGKNKKEIIKDIGKQRKEVLLKKFNIEDTLISNNNDINISILQDMMNGSALNETMIFYAYKGNLIVNESKVDFITSDDPVVITSYLYDTNNIIYYPITPKLAFIFYNDYPNPKEKYIYYKKIYSKEFVHKFNLMQLTNCYNEIYSTNIEYIKNLSNNYKKLIFNNNYENKIRFKIT
jgi:hypothetical protein